MRLPVVLGVLFALTVAGAIYALRVATGNEDAVVSAVARPASPDRPPADTPPPPVASAPPAVAAASDPAAAPDDGVLKIDLTGNASFFALFDELGIEDLDAKLAAWGSERGYPQLDDQGNPLLDQPYEQYDDDTLRAFADGNDMWAQQILAERLAKTRPAEALEWYRKAAISGSLHAMTEMARLYRQLAFQRDALKSDSQELEQVYALRDGPDSLAVTGYAWAAVAERAGWDPLRGGMTASFVGAKLTEDQIRAACDFSANLYADLLGARDDRGLGAYDRRPPPVVFDPGTTGGTACHSEEASSYLAGCREVEVNVDGQISRLWTCE